MSLTISHGISAGLASVVLIVLTGLSEAPRLIKSGLGFPSVSGGTLVYLAGPTRFTGSLASIDLPERKDGSAAISAKLEEQQRDSLLKQRLSRGLAPIPKTKARALEELRDHDRLAKGSLSYARLWGVQDTVWP